MLRKYTNRFKITAFALFALLCNSSFAEPQTYVFSVVPQFKPAQLQKEWNPLLERISRETGVKLKLNILSSIPKFEADLNSGAPDFAYANPYEAVLGSKSHGYIPMIRDSKPLNGILVVSKDSGIKKVTDLNDKVIGFPSPNAFGASLYLRARLAEDYAIKFTPKYLNNHNVVFNHVVRGHTAAGGSVNAALNDEPESVRNNLTVIYKTPDVASHPVIVHPRVPEQVRKSVINAFLHLQNDVEGRAMLKEVRLSNLVDANFQRDYSQIEKLNIQKFLVNED